MADLSPVGPSYVIAENKVSQAGTKTVVKNVMAVGWCEMTRTHDSVGRYKWRGDQIIETEVILARYSN